MKRELEASEAPPEDAPAADARVQRRSIPEDCVLAKSAVNGPKSLLKANRACESGKKPALLQRLMSLRAPLAVKMELSIIKSQDGAAPNPVPEAETASIPVEDMLETIACNNEPAQAGVIDVDSSPEQHRCKRQKLSGSDQ